MSKPKPKVGRRYRVDCEGHAFDGQCATLERIEGLTGWLMKRGEILPAPLVCLKLNGVLQGLVEPLERPAHFVRVFEVLEGASF